MDESVAADPLPNLHDDAPWDREMDLGPFGLGARSLTPGTTKLGATLYEVHPGKATLPYHAHHAMDEVIVGVRGTATVRTPRGDVQLGEGDVLCCPAGDDGAHQVRNDTDHAVRVMIFSNRPEVDAIEYPDSRKLQVGVGTWGTDSFRRWILDATATREYMDGELDEA
ncbi:MAG: cupin domain-containing protein [Thermoleophilia bacterium]|nr:cupin domain-containing protein [Thermoleophilia bacterium]